MIIKVITIITKKYVNTVTKKFIRDKTMRPISTTITVTKSTQLIITVEIV